jgi:putative glutamine amidotransferase
MEVVRMPPRIGITCNLSGFANTVSAAYVRAVAETGAVPLLLPVTVSKWHWEQMLHGIDGLLLSGGGDPDARHYGEEALPLQGTVQPWRDRMELYMARQALQSGLPLLGICRGAQILNIAAGGTLHQDLHGIASVQHDQKAPRNYPIHLITIRPSSLLYRIIRMEIIRVNSFHHQAVKTAGTGVRISARSRDHVIEAMEIPDHPFALGVQWHPEWLTGHYSHARALFASLTAAAERKTD